MMNFRKGCYVPHPEKLYDGYMVGQNMITANVSAEKIKSIMEKFILLYDEPLFFILELPTNSNDEPKAKNGAAEKRHKDVYYLDGCSNVEAFWILRRFGDLMIDDGLCAFGFGRHVSADEIMFGKYNITTVFAEDTVKYAKIFEEHGVFRAERLTTAYDTFTQDEPGVCERIETDGRDVFSIPGQLAEWGMYKAEQRED